MLGVASAGIALTNWAGTSQNLAAIGLVPVIWAAMGRGAAAVSILSYFLVGVWPVQPAVVTYFPGWPAAVSFFVWVVFAALLALPWFLATEAVRRGRTWASALAMIGCTAITMLPPVGTMAWCHPILSLGWLWPGSGLIGCVLLCAAWAVAASSLASDRARVGSEVALFAGMVGALALTSMGWEPEPGDSSRVVTVDTQQNVAANFEEVVVQVEKIRGWILSTNPAKGSVLVWPETTLANWSENTAYMVNERLLPLSKYYTLILGATWVNDQGVRYNGAAMLIDGQRKMLRARQPLALGMWRPWDAAEHHAAAWDEDLVLDASGVRIALRVCSEEFTPFWPLLDQWRYPGNTVQVGIGNTWWATAPVQELSHLRHATALARMVGQPLRRAINHGVALPPNALVKM